jgi:hypothetical protein
MQVRARPPIPTQRRLLRSVLPLAGPVLLLLHGTVGAQSFDSYSRLGLSASPDAYVSQLTIQPGEHFTLHLIAVGPQYGPLPFEVAEANWAIYATCCGQQAEIVSVEYSEGMEHTGTPLGGVESLIPSCHDGPVVALAAITFNFFLTRPSTYLMAAGASGPLYDCTGEQHLLLDLAVDVTVAGPLVADDATSWGAVKSLYR